MSNAGDGESSSSTLRYYRSTDSTISSSDTQVGTDAVGALAASGTSAESISLTAPSTAGTYYYGACVDAVTDESDTTNNCSASVTIAVEEESSGQPDLRIVGVVAGTPLDGVFPGTRIQFSASVRNYGDANSDATTLRYYRSTDATISVSDTEVGTDEVSALVPSVQVSEGIDLTAPSSTGAYYYGACVDAVTDESDTTNNCSASVKVDVEAPPKYPDLVVGTPAVDDATPETEASFTLSATVSNTGDGESPATTLRYYRSTDATITTSDTEVGTDAVGVLSASGRSSRVDFADGAGDGGNVLLRGVRRRGDGRIGHDEQLLGVGEGGYGGGAGGGQPGPGDPVDRDPYNCGKHIPVGDLPSGGVGVE